jgi:hypothetical protein
MVFNATFNNISDISWRSVLQVEESGVSSVNHRPVASHWQTLYYIKLEGQIEYSAHVLILNRLPFHLDWYFIQKQN